MKKLRFTESQIVSILKQNEKGRDAQSLKSNWCYPEFILS